MQSQFYHEQFLNQKVRNKKKMMMVTTLNFYEWQTLKVKLQKCKAVVAAKCSFVFLQYNSLKCMCKKSRKYVDQITFHRHGPKTFETQIT